MRELMLGTALAEGIVRDECAVDGVAVEGVADCCCVELGSCDWDGRAERRGSI